jgi:hypothetical protein
MKPFNVPDLLSCVLPLMRFPEPIGEVSQPLNTARSPEEYVVYARWPWCLWGDKAEFDAYDLMGLADAEQVVNYLLPRCRVLWDDGWSAQDKYMLRASPCVAG